MGAYGTMTAAQLDASDILSKKLASGIIARATALSVLNTPSVVNSDG